jgi:hypothetical protein
MDKEIKLKNVSGVLTGQISWSRLEKLLRSCGELKPGEEVTQFVATDDFLRYNVTKISVFQPLESVQKTINKVSEDMAKPTKGVKRRLITYYIAFSIHGTQKYHIATMQAYDLDDLYRRSGLKYHTGVFWAVESRRENYNRDKDGVKLHWLGLLNQKTREPYRNPTWVARKFKELETMGWTIVK